LLENRFKENENHIKSTTEVDAVVEKFEGYAEEVVEDEAQKNTEEYTGESADKGLSSH